MFWLLVGLTAVTTVLCGWWAPAAILRRWPRRRAPIALADLETLEWPTLVGKLLPRPLRAAWNGLVFAGCVLLVEGFHVMALYAAARSDPLPLWLYGASLLLHCAVVLVVALAVAARLPDPKTGLARRSQAQPEPTWGERTGSFCLLCFAVIGHLLMGSVS